MGMEFDFTTALGKLEELEKKVAKGITDKALLKGADEILDKQTRGVPVDSGDLKEALEVGKLKGSGAKRKVLVGIAPSKSEMVRYGYYQEHGTRVMLGKKWMKKSYYAANKKAKEKMAEVLAEELRGQ